MGKDEEELVGVDQALAELGKDEAELSEVRRRCSELGRADLGAIDQELDALVGGAPSAEAVDAGAEAGVWEEDSTDVEVVDESDFVLLVDESDLDALEKVGEEDAVRSIPPSVPEADDGAQDGFLKKLFGGRRASNRP